MSLQHRIFQVQQACRYQLRSQLIADISSAPDECLLLRDTPPLGRQPIQPDVVGIVRQLLPTGPKLPEPVMVDGSGGHFEQLLFRESQPVTHTEVADTVDA